MFGNILGWLISVALAGLTGMILFFYGTAPSVSESSGKFTAFVRSANLSVDPASFDLKPGTKDADAWDLHKQVIANYIADSHASFADQEAAKKHHGNAQWLHDNQDKTGVPLILEAAECAKCSKVVGPPEAIINYTSPFPFDEIEAMHDAGIDACSMAAIDLSRKNGKKAEPLLRAAFVLGYRMYIDRLSFWEYTAGTDLMKQAASGEARIAADAKDDSTADHYIKLGDAIDKWTDEAKVLWAAISGIASSDNQHLDYAGDMFEIARTKTNDPMWRIEAILKLGRMRFMESAGHFDQSGATRLVTKLAESKDPDVTPTIRLAAQKSA